MAEGEAGPILDLDKWRQGSDADREMWSLAARESLLTQLRKILAMCRRSYYSPSEPDDWSVPNMERHLARAEAVAGQTATDRLAFTRAVADFLGAVPPEMADDMRQGTMR